MKFLILFLPFFMITSPTLARESIMQSIYDQTFTHDPCINTKDEIAKAACYKKTGFRPSYFSEYSCDPTQGECIHTMTELAKADCGGTTSLISSTGAPGAKSKKKKAVPVPPRETYKFESKVCLLLPRNNETLCPPETRAMSFSSTKKLCKLVPQEKMQAPKAEVKSKPSTPGKK